MKKSVILCVDDEKIVLVSLKNQLKRHFDNQYIIETAENGAEAIDIFKELLDEHIDIPVIISDQIMPGMKGDELLKEIHTFAPKTLKILLTGQANAESIGNAVNCANLYRYIAKPWEQSDLNLTVAEAIRSYFQDKKLEEQTQKLYQLNQELQEQINTFYKFVPNQFLKVLNIQERERIELAMCVEQHMSVMFSDIRAFTTLSEYMTPKENFLFINSYLSHMGPIIRAHHGFIDKYIGDGIMALYERSDDALNSAINMLVHLVEYNQGRERAGYLPISIGIGLNSGALMLGTVGEHDRLQTTVIGDTVNLAARVENLTKTYDAPILITEYTLQQLEAPQNFITRLIDKVTVKGKTQPVTVFEVLDTLPAQRGEHKVSIAKLFEEALQCYYVKAFTKAESLFEKCLTHCPTDKASQIYLARIRSESKIDNSSNC
ncbi:MAG: adenylate/guanylate cyclase domain-containing protein [Pseudomonadota bacterium]|nr:adenylate/guanylate cyclase domain-containing protein [Pseudomonadota bacterium]